MRAAIAALVVTVAGTAHADTAAKIVAAATEAPATPAASEPPDGIADIESREANLESEESRSGLTFAGALGGGIFIGGDVGVGRGPAISLRLGHVATRKTVITFELTGSSALHKRSMTGDTLTDSNVALFVGAQRYTTQSLWVRAAGGPTILVTNANTKGGGGDAPRGGAGGLLGAGFDFAHLRYVSFGFETFLMTSVSGDGFKLQLGFSLGMSIN
jgi:hypothetical protein